MEIPLECEGRVTWRFDEKGGELDSSQNSRRSRCGAAQGGFHFSPFGFSFMPEVSNFQYNQEELNGYRPKIQITLDPRRKGKSIW